MVNESNCHSKMKRATMKWSTLLLLQFQSIIVTQQSITGVTYHDDFNFEERYRNLHECDPFYYHPLHLPVHCARIFEKLIRSRIAVALNTPVRVVREKERDFENVYSLNPNHDGYLQSKLAYPNYLLQIEDMYDIDSEDVDSRELDRRWKHMPPFEKMIELLRRDVRNNPTAPVLGMSQFGLVAMYEQPISKQSENLINTIARAYVKAGQRNSGDSNEYYYGKIETPSDPNNNEHKDNTFLFKQGTSKRNFIIKKPKHKNAKRTSKKHRKVEGLSIE